MGNDASDPVIARCTGQGFVFYCADADNWNLAPPSAWDVIDDGRCYDKESGSYYHSLAFGPTAEPLSAGFAKEWHWKNIAHAHYGEVAGNIVFDCGSPVTFPAGPTLLGS